MKVAVTGGTGFIGRHLVPELRAEGWEVVSFTEPGFAPGDGDPSSIPVDITSGEDLPGLVAGADAVVHLAARNHVLKERAKDPLAEYRRVNVDGTRNVASAAARAGARFFLHMSSIKAMGEESAAVLDENARCAPATPYGVSKLESEDVVRKEAGRSGMGAVILRLPMAYGPWNRGNLPRMIRWADRGFPVPLFRPDNLRSLVYVGNVVAGILALLGRQDEGVETYILKDREDCSTRTLYTTICRALGRTPRFLPVPAPIVRLGGMLSEDFRKMTGTFRVSSSKIEREIGFVPPFSLEEGIARTVRWYRCTAR